MLVIRKVQLQAFRKPLYDAFVDECVEHVLLTWPALASRYANREALAEFIRRVLDKARALGFRERTHLMTLLDWEGEFGPEFSERSEWAWLKSLLLTDINHASRIFRISRRLQTIDRRGES